MTATGTTASDLLSDAYIHLSTFGNAFGDQIPRNENQGDAAPSDHDPNPCAMAERRLVFVLEIGPENGVQLFTRLPD